MAKKNDNHDKETPATVTTAADILSGEIKLGTVEPEKPPGEAPPVQTGAEGTETPATPEPSKPVETPAVTPAPPIQGSESAATVTAAQLIAGDIPNATPLPPPPTDKKRGRGRPPGAKNKNGSTEPQTQSNIVMGDAPTGENTEQQAQTAEQQPAVNHRQLAEITFDLTTNSAAVFLGPEWRANNPQEREAMLVPLEMYLKTKQFDDIPPGAILCFALATYAAPRLRAPSTASKLRLGWAWLSSKFSSRRAKKVQQSQDENPFAVKNGAN